MRVACNNCVECTWEEDGLALWVNPQAMLDLAVAGIQKLVVGLIGGDAGGRLPNRHMASGNREPSQQCVQQRLVRWHSCSDPKLRP